MRYDVDDPERHASLRLGSCVGLSHALTSRIAPSWAVGSPAERQRSLARASHRLPLSVRLRGPRQLHWIVRAGIA
jgi:hypothetical protein